MKKPKIILTSKMISVIFIAFVLVSTMAGCSSKNEFEGRWKIQSGEENISFPEFTITLQQFVNNKNYVGDCDWYFENSEDVVIAATINGGAVWARVNYEINDGILRIYDKDTEIFSGPYSLADDILMVKFVGGDVIFTKVAG